VNWLDDLYQRHCLAIKVILYLLAEISTASEATNEKNRGDLGAPRGLIDSLNLFRN
jgi:hypothetical protein